jgi:uncharacterized protein (DUF111 family)
MSESMRLLMAQVDDVPGELLGEFIQRVEDLGARNVQIVASITKKGRPGYIVYIDVPARLESEVAVLLGAELGSWGYRVLAAEHKHFDIERLRVALTVSIAHASYEFELRAKTISHAGRFLRIKVEHDDLSNICGALREKQHQVPLAVLKAAVENQLAEPDNRTRAAVRF